MIKQMAHVEGPNLVLRLITPGDADYVYALRTDPTYNSHLSEVSGDVADQRAWIEAYKEREAAGQEYYYLIERHDGVRCGTVRLYNIADESFTWGSWILDHNKPPKAALESAVLSFGLAFDELGAALGLVDVRCANTHASAFYRRLGMSETHRTEQDIFFVYPRARFEVDRAMHLQSLGIISEEAT
jgi:hypothetical protein